MTRHDRAALLAAVDLEALADAVCGPRGRTRSWPCPRPDHPQTGKTPPLVVFRAANGDQRWHCHGCGAGGTAIDLLIAAHGVDTATAFADLARWAGHHPPPQPPPAPRGPDIVRRHTIDTYTSAASMNLWRAHGSPVRRWLMAERAIPEPVLRVNLIGADLAYDDPRRPPPLARPGRAAVLPAVHEGCARYFQLRAINPRPDRSRYLNPPATLAANPRIARYHPADTRADGTVICEGVLDALSAATAGYDAIAVLGANTIDRPALDVLAEERGPLIVAFDADHTGRAAAARLVGALTHAGRPAATLELPDGLNDLNDWLRTSRRAPLEIHDAIADAAHHLTLGPTLER